MAIKETTVKLTPGKILGFIHRQESLPKPNKEYIAWLRKQFIVYCVAEIKNENRN